MSFFSKKTCRATSIWLACWFLIPPAGAALKEEGTVNMQGTIINSPCTIAMNDLQQSISLGTLPIAALAHQGKGVPHRFTLFLTDCVIERNLTSEKSSTGFQTTFEGDSDGTLFTLQGSASGVALQITDSLGNVAVSGKALPLRQLAPGNMQLNYFLTPVHNHLPLVAGDFFATISFKLDYF